MKRNLLLKLTTVGTLLMFLTTNLFAQTNTTTQLLNMGINGIQLINAVDSTATNQAISLLLTTNTAGTKISGGTNQSFLQLSSIVSSASATNKVQASVTGVPAGTSLSLTTQTPANLADADGSFGSGSGTAVTLANGAAAVDVITGIGSCYTGTAALDGYLMQWNWDAGASGTYSQIYSTSAAQATVTFTITAGP